jgi:ribosomal protein S18 acetylase RimI-like enzyme
MISIQRLTLENVQFFKAVRLRALQDSPFAFGSTYAGESQFTDDEWLRRAQNWDGVRGAGFLAIDEKEACGIAGSFLDEKDSTQARLVSMWTAPTHRMRGVGALLVRAAQDWARNAGAGTMRLMVTSHNPSAQLFYERLGFTFTGVREPWPNDPAHFEYEMSRSIFSDVTSSIAPGGEEH